jgi:hypothetical protein
METLEVIIAYLSIGFVLAAVIFLIIHMWMAAIASALISIALAQLVKHW